MAGIPFLPFSQDELFLGMQGVLPAWILLVLAPKWGFTHQVALFSAFAYGLFYIGLFAGVLEKSGSVDLGSMMTLKGVQAILTDKDNTLLVGLWWSRRQCYKPMESTSSKL